MRMIEMRGNIADETETRKRQRKERRKEWNRKIFD
jgi:hypothetical protein